MRCLEDVILVAIAVLLAAMVAIMALGPFCRLAEKLAA